MSEMEFKRGFIRFLNIPSFLPIPRVLLKFELLIRKYYVN
jgi:hypothetical protein